MNFYLGLNRNNFQLTLTLITLLLIQCTSSYSPTEESTSYILKTLSSDEMKGRQALSQDISKAENFIANQFQEIGLSKIGNTESFKQDFSISEINLASTSVSISGKKIPSDSYFGSFNGGNINWINDGVKTVSIASTDDFRSTYQIYSASKEDLLVFVDPSHSDIFSRYQAFFSRPSRVVEGDDKANVLFVLTKTSPSFFIEISTNIEKKELANIVGIIEGKRDNELVLFSAHHDHIGIRNSVEGDSIANGANDNASGVTAVLELAKHFKSLGKPERTLVFATFTAEEMGGYGSQYFSKQFNPDEIVAMFNIEMIGKPAVSGSNTAWITGYDKSSFGELLSKSAEGTIYEFYADPYPQQNLFYRSDNATLARLGVPAHTISTTPIDVDKDYHQVSDEFNTINIPHLTNTIKAIAKAAKGIISGKDTPTRVDVSLID